MRLYPTTEQKQYLAQSFGCCRWYWNYSLNLANQSYKETGKGLSRGKIQALLPSLKQEHEWLKTPYSQCLQVVALNLSRAFVNFLEKRAKYPSFKPKHGKQSISYPQNVKLLEGSIKFPGLLGVVKATIHRAIEGAIRTVTVSMNSRGHYYASVLVEDGTKQPQTSTQAKAMGLDVGLNHLVVTSSGSKYNNPKWFRRHEKNLKRKQQSLSRKVKGSISRAKARIRVARVHDKISRCRSDFLHKLSRRIVDENQVIVVENLQIKGMVKNHNLAKSISDSGWGMFMTMLKYKAEWDGKLYLEVDRFFPSSKICSVCLNQIGSLPLDVRSWTCSSCFTHHDRDTNAAINIRNEGLRILSLGTRDTAVGGSVRLGDGNIKQQEPKSTEAA